MSGGNMAQSPIASIVLDTGTQMRVAKGMNEAAAEKGKGHVPRASVWLGKI